VITVLMARLQGWALTTLAVLAVLVGAYAYGHRTAKKAAKKESDLAEAQRATAGAKGVEDARREVDKLPDGGAADELRRDWMRDDPADPPP
jgi:type III secretory pathway component EscV